jgi:N-methylhydantoinase A
MRFEMPSLRIAVDIGGTFTDVATLDERDNSIRVCKVPTTPKNFVQGFLDGLNRAGLAPNEASYVIHGTTVATNAVIQRSLPSTALLATEGFRDVLEIMRGNRPAWGLYDIRWKKPAPIIPRHMRFGIAERVDYRGRVIKPLDENQARSIISGLKQLGVRSVAICFLFSNMNPSHERRVADLISEAMPEATVSLSSEVNPEVREYERTSTTAIDASVKPVVADYLGRLEGALAKLGFRCPLMIMRSGGGMMSSRLARRIPIHTIESGPAGGVIGAASLVTKQASRNLLAIDMGGTTFKVSVIEEGKPRLKNESEIEWGVPYRIPMIDLSEIGAGGGSIAWIDRGGVLRVGPQSAGADPGPVCYGLGGTKPTFTDASLVLGRIDPEYFLGGEMKLNYEASKEAIERDIAKPLDMDVLEAASGIVRIAEANMAASMRVSSVERGYDPRDFVTVAYGGAGPLVATSLAQELGSPSVLIPPHPGIFSAIGMLYSDLRLDVSRTFIGRIDSIKMEDMSAAYRDLESKATSMMSGEGFKGDVAILRSADIRYVGQNYEVGTPVPSVELNEARRKDIASNFNMEHTRLYGHSKPDEPIEVLTLRVAAVGSMLRPTVRHLEPSRTSQKALRGHRPIYYEESKDYLKTPIFERTVLGAGLSLEGPAVIEEMDSTTIIRPGQTAEVDDFGNIVISLR